MVRETELQARRRKRATGISKKWKIARKSQRPRGLPNSANDCYRNGTIQPLVNFPRFVNWILSHNTNNGNWSCRDDNPDHSLAGVRGAELSREVLRDETYKHMTPEERTEYKKKPHGGVIRPMDLEGHEVENYSGCLPCLLKALMVDYWGKGMLDNKAPHDPISFPYNHPSVYLLHQLFQRYFCENPEGHSETIGNLNLSQAEIDRRTRVARRDNMTDQQDVSELFSRIFAGIQSSFDRETPDGLALGEQLDSLFKVDLVRRHICIHCKNSEVSGEEGGEGLYFQPLQKGRDTVSDGIDRYLTEETVETGNRCSNCHKPYTFQKNLRINSTPEYLRIHLNLSEFLPAGGQRKIRNPITIEDTLDLTNHMENREDEDAASVVYKIHSVTYHAGESVRAGHYIASVTGPGARKSTFLINDRDVRLLDSKMAKGRNPLTLNPLISGVKFDAVTLWYERVYTRSKGKTADQLTVNEGKALVERLDQKKQNQGDGTVDAGHVTGGKTAYITKRGRKTYR